MSAAMSVRLCVDWVGWCFTGSNACVKERERESDRISAARSDVRCGQNLLDRDQEAAGMLILRCRSARWCVEEDIVVEVGYVCVYVRGRMYVPVFMRVYDVVCAWVCMGVGGVCWIHYDS